MTPTPRDLHPLSYGQRALWFLQKLAPGSAAYNLPFAGRFAAPVDGEALRRGFQALADRHPALRTTYPLLPEGEGAPLQWIHERLDIDFAEIDAGAWTDDELRREVTAASHRPIALERPPAVRLRLFRRAAGDGVLLLVLHHIAVDFLSLALILTDLRQLLADAFAGRPAALPPPAGRYADFARWQAEMLQGPEGERAWEYWRNELAGELPALALPTDRPRPRVQSFRGGLAGFHLEETTCAGLARLAATAETSLFAVVAAAFQALLHRASGQDEIVVGSTLPGRPGTELRDVVGFFVNTVLLRGDLAGDPPFRRLLARTARGVSGAVAHQHFPFTLLVERLAPERDLGRSPLYQVLLAFYEGGAEEQVLRLMTGGGGHIDLGPLALEPFAIDRNTSMLDLTLNVIAMPDRMGFSLQYDADLFDAATAERLAAGLRGLLEQAALDPDLRLSELPPGRPAERAQLLGGAGRPAEPAPRPPQAEPAGSEDADAPQGIAIIGLAARFPGAPDAERFWENLRAGVESITFFDREELRAAGTDPALLDHPHFVRAAGRLDGVELFDAGFFHYNAREASIIDPQQRAFLECAWEALEDAACDPETFGGPIGVYAGVSAGTWLYHLLAGRRSGDAVDWLLNLVGNDKDFIATRTSYKLGLTGPSLTVQTACSTSLVATHLACQSLLNGECDVALAGGASITTPQERGYLYSPAGIMSPDGHCRAFDARARGTVSGSGVGVVVLKRLEDALADGDRIRAVIRGSAVTNDGSHKAGFTAPSAEGQGRAIAEALAVAGVAARSIAYVETHGSGTPLGDSIEVAALHRAFAAVTESRRCALGSVKTNIGHLDAAAGIAGLIKTVLALERGALPASLHCEEPSPRLRLDEGPFYVNTRLSPWPAGSTPRRAGVSSFGLGGTNAHLILEEAPAAEAPAPSRPWQLLLLSARTPGALEAATDRLGAHLAAHPEQDLADVAYTTQLGRRAFKHRRMLVCRDRNDAGAALAGRDPVRLLSGAEEMAGRPVAFAFPGLGEHYPEMGRGLYEQERGFRERVDLCAELLLPLLGVDLREVLYPAPSRDHRGAPASGGIDLKAMLGRGAEAGGDGRLDRTTFAHPALFAVEVALAGLWQDWGVVPQAVMGYSLGEYAAACIADVFSLEDALLLVARRAQMIDELPEGGMLAVPLAPADLSSLLGADLSVAAVNGPQVSVVAGPLAALAELEGRLAAEGLAVRRLRTRHAFHCGLMEPVAERLTRLVAEVPRRAPKIPCLSNVTGTWLRPEEAVDPGYWARHLLGTVRFADNLAELWNEPGRILLEIGPGQSLAGLALQHPARAAAGFAGPLAVPSLPAAYERHDDQAALLTAAGRLWLEGVRVDWRRFHAGARRRPVGLPTYPFERQRYGLEGLAQGRGARAADAPAAGGTSVHARPNLANAYVAPQSDLERTVARLWQELLGVEQVGAHDSFFALGGHSLLATQVISRLADSLGLELSLEQIFAAPTVAELAAAIAATPGFTGEAGAPRPTIPRRPDPGRAPLSFAQQRLWFIDQFQPGSPLYNVPVPLRVGGPLDARVLALCLGEIRRRHETLRTVFAMREGAPVQVILPAAPFALPVVDLAALPPHRREALALRLTREEHARPFDLARDPLLRAVVLRLVEGDHVVALTLHHIVSDSWSIGILVREVTALYAAFAAGRPSPLPDVPVQYADFATWQSSWLQGEILETEISYWRQQLAGLPPLLALPTDRPRPAVQSFRGSSRPVQLPALTREAEDLGRREGATLFMVLLAGFQALLARLSGQTDLALGAPVAGRNRVEVEPLIGFFVNTLVLRGSWSGEAAGEPSFRELLGRARETALAAYRHQEVPFEKLVQELAPERRLDHSPLFQVMLVLQNAPAETLHIESLSLRLLRGTAATAKFDLTFNLEERDGALCGEVEYATDLFDATTIDRLLGQLERLLAAALAEPGSKLSELALLSPAERHQIGVEWNDTAAPRSPGGLLHGLFAAQVARTPDAPALVYDDRTLSYAALDRVTDRLAGRLRALGVGPDVAAGVLMERSVEMVVALLGVLKAGGAYLAIDPEHPAERIAWMLRESGTPVVLAQEALLPRLPAHGATVLCLEAGWAGEPAAAGAAGPADGMEPDHLAYVLYTSGSTGRPKGVMIPHRGIVNRLLWMQEAYGLTPQDRVLQKTPFGFDVSVWEFFWPLITGSCLVVAGPGAHRDAAGLTGLIDRERITVTHFVPSMLQAFLDQPELAGCPSLRLVVASGEALSSGLRRQFQDKLPARLENLYGPTEAAVDVTAWSCATVAPGGAVPIGRPVANTRIDLLDRSFRPVPAGVAGELCIGGVQLARGYWRRPDLAAERFVPDPCSGAPGGRLYRTGDLARHLPDGSIEFLGRIDHQVKIRGFRIELGEIEAALVEQGRLRQALVLARQDGPSARLVAYVVPGEGEPADPAAWRAALLTRLPAYMIPAAWVVLPALPVTANGKVDRRALPAPEAPSGGAEPAEPATPAEQVLAAVWAEVLRVETVGRHDNFFALGGDSILSIQICARARKAGVHISPRLLFQHQTVAQLATVANTAGRVVAEQGLVTGDAPLTPIQRRFFADDPAAPHHFNQSVLFATTGRLAAAPLRAALERLERHHDALRLRFFREPAGWRQAGGPPAASAPLAVLDLAGLPPSARLRALTDATGQAQAGLDLQNGPLHRALLLDLGAREPGRFFWTIHHLAVDGVSWRILLEDLATLYQAFSRGGEAELPAKTTSFRHWAERLAAHAAAPETEAELSRWRDQPWTAASPLPLDRPPVPAGLLTASEGTVSLQLDTEETRELLQGVPRAYNTQINDVLLAALAAGFQDWTGSAVLSVDLEGHGREELFPDVDLSRTVGWLTSIYPVLLDLRQAADPASALKAVKEELRRVPRGGLGYGLLRWGGRHAEALGRLPRPEVLFNYFGQLDQALSQDAPFRPAHEPAGPSRSPLRRRSHLLSFDAGVLDGRLAVTCTYSRQLHRQETVQRLVDAVAARLRVLIAHCRAPESWGYTPADFPLAALGQERLDALVHAHIATAATAARHPIEEIHPLSPMQQGMLFHTVYAPQTGAYVLQLSGRIRGDLDREVFRKAWAGLIARHAALRTSFHWEGLAQPLQVVARTVEVPLTFEDWSGLPEPVRRERLAACLREDLARGFPLDRAPLLRLLLLQEGDGVHRLVWSTHLILMDGWSQASILRELFTLYAALCAGAAPDLPALPPYRDYIAWLLRQETREAEDFWKRELAGIEGATPLPGDRGRGGQPDIRQDRVVLSAQTTAALQALGRTSRITLNTLVQGAWALLLAHGGGNPDVTFGATVSGRPAGLPGIESMIGLFINTLPVRASIAPQDPLLDWLRNLQDRQAAARQYEHVPLADVQTWSPVPRGTPLFESLVVFENYPVEEALAAGGAGLQLDEVDWKEATNYPLVLVALPGRQLTLMFFWDRARFARAEIQRLLQQLAALCEAIARRPQARLGEIDPLTAWERHQLLVEWNAGAEISSVVPQAGATLHHLFERQAARSPDAIALVCGERRMSYGALDEAANRLAAHLRTLTEGLGEPRIALLLDRSPDLVVALLAALKAGGAYVPIDPAYPPERIAFLLEDSAAAVLVTEGSLADALPRLSLPVVRIDADREVLAASPAARRAAATDPAGLAYVIYTSGSTGRSKGVPVTHANVVRLFAATEDGFGFGPGDVWTFFHSSAFDFSVWEIWGALLYGGRLVIVPRPVTRSPEELYTLLADEAVTVLNQTPSAFQQLVARDQAGPARDLSLRLVIFGGEALSLGMLRPWFERHGDLRPRLVNMYGITETTVHVTWRTLAAADADLRSSPIGRPLPDLQVHLVGVGGRPVPVGAPGEIQVGGAGLARGYLGRPDLTAGRFVPDAFGAGAGARLYRSGDLARRSPDGALEYLGRIDHQVKIRGYRIELGEIEAELLAQPDIREAVVVAHDHPSLGRSLIAYVVTQADERIGERLRERLLLRLPQYMVPAVFVLLPALPLTPNGKVDRKALPAPGRPSAGSGSLPPRTPDEELVAGLWADILGLERIGREDNFFELGGHSLLATRLISRLRSACGVELPLRTLFEKPTVAELGAAVEEARRDGLRRSAPLLVPVPRTGDLPLSFAQERLWFLDRLQPESSSYNLPLTLEVRGALSLPVLAASLAGITARHETLRTTFRPADGPAGSRPVQSVAPQIDLCLPRVDLAGLPERLRRGEVRRLAREEAARPFDLTRGPLLRATLLRLDGAVHVLLFTQHHVISDGWSLGVLVDELTAHYRALAAGEAPALPPLPIQYADYAVWQRRLLADETLAARIAWWRQRLAGAPHRLDLPGDRPRATVQSVRGAQQAFTLPAELAAALHKVSRREGTTLFMTLASLLAAVLCRHTGAEDLLLGSPVAGRDQPETERLIGLFVNTIVLRAELSGDPAFSEILRRMREMTLGAYTHQDLPFEKLVDSVQPERSLAHTPLFQVLLVLQNTPLAALELPGLTVTPVPVDGGAARFDLQLSAIEQAGTLGGTLEYNRDLFDPATAARLLGHLCTLAAGAVRHPETRLSELPLLSAAEAHQIWQEWNDTAAPRPAGALLHALFGARAAAAPDAPALVCDDRTLTFAALDRVTDRLAHRLRAQGVGPDVAVGVLMERSIEMVVALLGILKAGGGYLPLDPEHPAERLAGMIEDAQAPVLLVQEATRKLLPPVAARAVVLAAGWDGSGEPAAGDALPEVADASLAYVIYTSGSTGRPKGVMIPHRGIVNRLLWMRETYGLGAGDRFLQKTPYTFDVSVWELFYPLISGSCLVIARPGGHRDGAYLCALIARERVTVAHFVPSMLGVFLAQPDLSGCASLRLVIASGEALSPAARHDHRQRLAARLDNLYGPTEASVEVTSWSCAELGRNGALPIGRPVANTAIRLLDRFLQPVPLGVPGELCIGGVQLARGYWRRPELTAERFIPDAGGATAGGRLYRTGDLARHLPDGAIEFLGRIDHQVKIRGFRIEPGEIEAALAEHPGVRHAVVVARGDQLVAWFVPSAGGAGGAGAAELRTHLRRSLPEHMVPAAFLPLAELPLTASGKVDRRALPEAPREAAAGGLIAPRDPVEETLAAIWSEVLGVGDLGVHDNFFDVGGHSLRLLEVQAAIRRTLGRDLPVVELFRHPTIAALAAFLGGGGPTLRRHSGAPRAATTDIAILAMEGRFPGAPDLATFWHNLREGIESIERLGDEQLLAAGLAPGDLLRPDLVRAEALLPGIDLFDAAFFGFSPREAQALDPQQRLFLEQAWACLESAGYDPARYAGRIGVFAGSGMGTYAVNLLSNAEMCEALDPLSLQTSIDKDYLATRVAYKLGLRGPALSVQTACSTSLVAVHLARQSLLAGECEMALAGGVTLKIRQGTGYRYHEGAILSPDGHCRAFDAAARGTVSGSGSGLVLLKRLDEALRDGDTIRAVLKGSAINNDGAFKVGYTAPSVEGQAEAVSAALDAAGVSPDGVTYVEAHGTATPLGDPIEVAALTQAFQRGSRRAGPCFLGSVKTNIGHLDAAAGVAGLIKTVLALEHGQIPPSLHFERPNPAIDFAAGPFQVAARLADWPADGGPRRAGVSSFGIGGTNAHAVLEEAPPAEPSGASRPFQLLLLSARTADALEDGTSRLGRWLAEHPEVPLADVAHTLRLGRRPFEHRRMLVCASREEALAALQGEEPARLLTLRREKEPPAVAWLFPGQGSQHPGMGRDLYESEPVFRRELDACADLLAPRLGRDLRQVLFSSSGAELAETRYAQPALFAVEHALARLWLSWGLRPQALIGHSLGEYVAACLAGVLSLDDALTLVAARGELMQELPRGAMLSVELAEDATLAAIAAAPGLSLAAVNSPGQCVVSGPVQEVEALASTLSRRSVAWRRLPAGHAFHSGMMDPILDRFGELVARIELRPPAIPCLSNLTGTWMTASDATDPRYWTRHLRETVRFGDGVSRLLAELPPHAVLLEAGPGRALGRLVRSQAAGRTVLASMPHRESSESGAAALLEAVGRLWLAGVEIDWQAYQGAERRRRVPLPTYPFRRQRFWVDAPRQDLAARPAAEDARRFLTPGQVRLRDPGNAEVLRRLLEAEPDLRLLLPLAAEPESAAAPAEPLDGNRRPDLPTPYREPQSGLEQRLAAIWGGLLGIDRVGAHDDFFELGGHSLLATRVLSQVRQELGYELPLETLFAAPTVALLAARLAAGEVPTTSQADPILPVPRSADLPLSFAQQRLLFLAVAAPGDPSYNLLLGLRLDGRLDPRALQLALDALVSRHEPLRTTFHIHEVRVTQQIAPAARLPLHAADLTGLPSALRAAEAKRLAVEQARHPFDLLRGPVVLAVLAQLSATEHLLLLTVHHIAADGWSFSVLARDLTELYQARVEGRPSRLPELDVQYADFAAWQRTPLQEERLEHQLGYWRTHLAGSRPTVLPTDRPRPSRPSGVGAALPTALPAEHVAAAHRLAREEDATLFMVLLGAFAVLLHHATGCDDLVIGTDIANRNRRETENLIGLFVNQLALRCDLSGNPTFRELLRRMRRATLNAYAHQDAPFDRLVETLNPVRDLGTTPLFQAKLVLQNAALPLRELKELQVSPLPVHNQTAKFDLLLNLAETGDAISGVLEYSVDLWDEASMARLLADFATAFALGTARPDERLHRIGETLARASRAGDEARTIRRRRAISVTPE